MTHQTLADGQNTNTTCKRDKLLVVNYHVKFHLTIFYRSVKERKRKKLYIKMFEQI